ncbi:MAG: hypothetical protein J6C46_00785 [Clostridia bacterium]|nr:hypothetical protein [Clostridia bacterium]
MHFTYSKILQGGVDIDDEARALSRILLDFDELADAGFDTNGNQLFFYIQLEKKYICNCQAQVD